ncbi:MAG: translesion error-prone DNA polymerase V autoproteolytic subunit [Blastocatellia bacterium]|nr:translesion error-prone DNA polymerase V autoproteolytic subunit [Blastocatellia bacterium]MBO0800124.1 translesion error-prone DNA polymerase V autoproteolytic subunit [Blastocatellia bacterium]
MIEDISPPPMTEGKSAWGGFPSPADDYLQRALDLNDHLVPHPISTFFIEVKGDALAGEKIFDGDTLVVDRAADIRPGHIVVAVFNGEFLLRKLVQQEGRLLLFSGDPGENPIELNETCEIWGRVMWSLTKH